MLHFFCFPLFVCYNNGEGLECSVRKCYEGSWCLKSYSRVWEAGIQGPIAWKSNGKGRTVGKVASEVGQTRDRYAAERVQSHCETRDLEPEDDDMNSSCDDEDENESSDDASEENPDTLARLTPSNNPLIIDGIQWTAVDAITANHFDGDHHSMRIQWGDDAHISSRSVYDFFLMMFPTHMLTFWTSTVLKDAGQAETSPQE